MPKKDVAKLKCLFGFHEYTIPDKCDSNILICKHCRRFGYGSCSLFETWTCYDVNRNRIYTKYFDGVDVNEYYEQK